MQQPVWNTLAGDLGTFPSGKQIQIHISAIPVSPATELEYRLLNGTFPIGCQLSPNGVITGIPTDTPIKTVYIFTVRVTDNFNNITDRTFSFTVYGFVGAYFLVKSAEIINTLDSIFVDYQIQYSNPTIDNIIKIELSSGELPPGLYIDDKNRIRGYPVPPIRGDRSPIVKSYIFSLQLTSALGNDATTYTIKIRNQELYAPRHNRVPVITNSKWMSYPIDPNNINYSYYLQDDNRIPTIKANEYFAFKILGHDFDKDRISYSYGKLPIGLIGDPDTGWIKGIPVLSENSIQENLFTVQVYKTNNPSIISSIITYKVIINNNIQENDIVWDTDVDLGVVDNGSTSELYVHASSSNELRYQLVSGNLPPNISLMPYTGHLVGNIPFEPNNKITPQGSYTEYKFTVNAYNPRFALISSKRTFTLRVYQKYSRPLEKIYVKAFPNILGRKVISSLLNSNVLIPPEYLYRPDDANFGRAKDVTYTHCYGMQSVNIEKYYDAVEKYHYTKKIILGPLNTAIARDSTGMITYEVIYSPIIDDLRNQSPNKSSRTVTMPYKVELNKNAYKINNNNLLIDSGKININAGSVFTRTLYPNSLENMRKQLLENIPNIQDQTLLPSWMTSQQLNGDTLGYQECWVLCYCLPGTSEYILNTINTTWAYSVNDIDFTIDRYIIDKSMSYNYNTNLKVPNWTNLPGATPIPAPSEVRNVTVFFPNKTILPNN